ncbi:DUF790 family protein [Candidatus Laterigemmans baculatus]|uniref:DUF790 family protein n=1 Tax=Candidatus Laterigemmans baculatus TaxID=2770505 RepID=UPI0013DD1ECB|nr:DUF790 family protein [Candidatus Laterigemmans baculatus]
MLTSAQCIVEYDFARRLAVPDRLSRKRDERYLRAAARLLAIYRRGVGSPRGELHRRVGRVLEAFDDCPPRRVAAFCKLLDDASSFASAGRSAAELRRRVFSLAADRHPLVTRPEGIFESTLEQAHREIAAELGRSWQEIEANLFADVIELQRLQAFDSDWQPAELLAAYNVAQTQALLYRAVRMTVTASEDMKTILRHAKLAGLMHEIRRLEDGRYWFIFDGPASALRNTSRYGVRFARMIPKLLSCQGWQLQATIAGPRNQFLEFRLSPDDRLRSPLAAPEPFDSTLEAEIVERWHAATPDGWRLERESEILHRGQQVFTPDFVLRREGDDSPIYVELVGYWTPEYLDEKRNQLQQFASHRWILIVTKSNSKFTERAQLPTLQLTGTFKPTELVELATTYYASRTLER